MKKSNVLWIALALTLSGCSHQSVPTNPLAQDESRFDTIVSGRQVKLYTLQNEKGMMVQITNYGGRIVSLIVPDKNKKPTDVVWGFESIKDYLTAGDVYAGPLVGRYGNRIAKGKFSIDGHPYQVSINNGPNHLHGGKEGFYTKVWDAVMTKNDKGENALLLTYTSADNEDGYPGNLQTTVTYTLTNDNSLKIDYSASTDKPTVCNPTIHPYINLHGTTNKSIKTHLLQVNASNYTPTDSTLIPTGVIAPVAGTLADFRKPYPIGARITEDGNDMMRFGGGGYDLNFVLDRHGKGIEKIATLYEPSNEIAMDILTDQPGLQFYSGNCINGTDVGKRGELHRRYSGIALETQHYPDSPNHPNFPSTILRPGEKYSHHVIFHFYTTKEIQCAMIPMQKAIKADKVEMTTLQPAQKK